MTALALHPQTAQLIAAFAARPSHAVLVHGPVGSGKSALASQLAATILGLEVEKLGDYPYLLQLDGAAISSAAVEGVRQLEHFLSLRVLKVGVITRIVIITDAQVLSLQAQNALLKTIEEPPQATLLILTAPSQASLLPTISSRLQAIQVKRPSRQTLSEHFEAAKHGNPTLEQAYAISGGLAGLMSALLTNSDHPLRPATETARQLLQQTIYQRLLLVDDLTKQKTHVVNTLFILQQMAHARLQTTSGAPFRRWQLILKASYEASVQLNNSAQPKLVLDSLMLKLN